MLRRFVHSRAGKIFAASIVTVPAVSGLALYGYVTYRVATKPIHEPRILVANDGRLLEIDGATIQVSRWDHVIRLAQLTIMYMPLFLMYYLMCYNAHTYRLWLKMLLFMVQRSGPAIIKAGQWACTRYDMFTPEFREVFGVLYSAVYIHDVKHSQRIIEKEMKPVDELFSSFDPVPVGSGSIGQCHVAVMRDSGRKVAVKVMHPNVVRDISRDIYLINLAARFVDRWVPAVDYMCLPDSALAWTNHLAAQIDFRVEAENLQSFRENFHDILYVNFPEPIAWSKQVLVESFAEGEPATEAFLKSQNDYMKNKLAFAGMNCFCKMLLRDNFIHCDMHPGNILISTKTDPPCVTLIDVGLVQRLGEQEAKMSNDLMSGFCYWEPKKIAETFLSMGTKQKWCQPQKFIDDLTALLNYYRPAGVEGEYAVIGDVLGGCFDIIRNNKVQLDPHYVSLMFSVLVLESFVMTLNPMFNIAQNSAPWLVSEGHISARVWKSLAVVALGNIKSLFFHA
jgi:aarF domain-containing kinase